MVEQSPEKEMIEKPMIYQLTGISPQLWRRVKIKAAKEGVTVKKFIMDLLEEHTDQGF
jgi:predicted DNA binding CopG/RHH family protein